MSRVELTARSSKNLQHFEIKGSKSIRFLDADYIH